MSKTKDQSNETEGFTDTELTIISLVLSQYADNHDDDEEFDRDYTRNIYRISSKAREMIGSSDE